MDSDGPKDTDTDTDTFVMGGYSHLVPAGTFRVSVLIGFVCPCIMLCLWRVLLRLAARRYLSCRGARPRNVTYFVGWWPELPPKMRAQLISVQFASAREFRAGKSFSNELRSSTVEFEQSSRLLCYGVETI